MTKALNILEIIKKEKIRLDFVFTALKSGTIGFISGAGGTGKSLFALNIAFSLADTSRKFNYEPLITKDTPRGKVFYLSLEDPTDILEHRIQDISGKIKSKYNNNVLEEIADNLYIYPLCGVDFTLFRQNQLSRKIYDTLLNMGETARLVIIDTFRRLHDENENDNGIMSQILKSLEGICRETGTTILLLHHKNKNATYEKNNDQTALRGASALVDNARLVINLSALNNNDLKKYKIDEKDKTQYTKINFAKVNYSSIPNDFIFRKTAINTINNEEIEEIKIKDETIEHDNEKEETNSNKKEKSGLIQLLEEEF